MKTVEIAARLVRAVSKSSGVDGSKIIGKERGDGLSALKWACWLVMRDRGITYTEIADVFCHNHSSVIKGIRKARAMRSKAEDFDHFALICQSAEDTSAKIDLQTNQ